MVRADPCGSAVQQQQCEIGRTHLVLFRPSTNYERWDAESLRERGRGQQKNGRRRAPGDRALRSAPPQLPRARWLDKQAAPSVRLRCKPARLALSSDGVAAQL